MLISKFSEISLGERKISTKKLNFDNTIRLEFHGSTITSDAGLLAYRELDHAFGLTRIASDCFNEIRQNRNTRHSIGALLRQHPMLL
jgi:hypothetical protein